MFRKKGIKFSTTRMIVSGFLAAIVIGTFLLSLPAASRNHTVTPLVDSLFTATTSICVTGLTVVNTLEHWSVFGQMVILLLIQFGGLGVVTFTTTIFLLLGRRITLSERLVIQDAYNLDTLKGLVKLTIRIIKGTLVVEGIGAVLFCFRLIPEYGLAGIWKSVFLSVSAFCNAGMDILGPDSLVSYRGDVLINVTTMLLIILGGIGFPVWWNVVEVSKGICKKEVRPRGFWSQLNLHTKLVITATLILIFGGAVILFGLEFNNSQTIGGLPMKEKVLASVFQSVTTRTAGFLTVPQENLTPAASFLSIFLMFIGGSPSGTAGGVKTVTIVMLCLSALSIAKGRKDVEIFGRRISENYIRKGLAVVLFSFTALFVSTMALSITEQADFLDTLYECTSAIGTVGLSRNLTGTLSTAGKLVVAITMYLGRVGPITMALAFNAKKYRGIRTLPDGKIIVG